MSKIMCGSSAMCCTQTADNVCSDNVSDIADLHDPSENISKFFKKYMPKRKGTGRTTTTPTTTTATIPQLFGSVSISDTGISKITQHHDEQQVTSLGIHMLKELNHVHEMMSQVENIDI